jgi:hypothetical protein
MPMVAKPPATCAQASGVRPSELLAPFPNRFVADHNTLLQLVPDFKDHASIDIGAASRL